MEESLTTSNWFEDYSEEEENIDIDEYDITASPNDFNLLTIHNFIESEAISIPGFQRNYVWDLARASKLIESLILGLPVPQIFLYEEGKNKFQVIDGQQRLMSIYYFVKQRFPKKEKRVEIRKIFDEFGKIPEKYLHDDVYFDKFNLKLPSGLPDKPNKFHGLNYGTLNDYKTSFDLRTIRNVIIKQNSPKDDDSSVYEIFYRLNSGGINLKPQEIRISLYHSEFYEMLRKLNSDARWRRLINSPEPDLHIKDIEILLRGFAMLIDNANYAPSLTKFLNKFSKKCKNLEEDKIRYLQELFLSFLEATQNLDTDAFLNKKNNRFNIALFEAVFTAVCKDPFSKTQYVASAISADKTERLENDPDFTRASLEGTTSTTNVKKRIERAEIIFNE